ncbi:MAG: hypothetical protein Q4D96_02195 [Propionibacteriaceae bacterium]|nr:hypothetical protein [Propionibacteriaceae bacterium]
MTRIITRTATVAMALALAFGASACAGGKPSKDELKAAFEKAADANQTVEGEMKEKRDKALSCIVDRLHDSMSAEGLKKLLESANSGDERPDREGLSDEDQKVIDEATKECNPFKS